MLKEDEVIMLDDNKEYYVLDSLVKNDNNFVMLGEINGDEVTDNIKIMMYDKDNNKITKVTDPTLLFQLTSMFLEKQD